MFSDVLLAFTCASAVGNLWSICIGVNILSPVPLPLKLNIFFNIFSTIFGFSFSQHSVMLIPSTNLINSSIMIYLILSFLLLPASHKSFTKDDVF